MRWRTRGGEPDWYDEDDEEDEDYEPDPYVIIEKQDSVIGPFLLGIALGAGVALLFAPQSGEETRRGMARSARRAQNAAQDFVEDVSDTVADKVREVKSTVEEKLEATLDAVDERKRRVTNAFHAGRAAAREARGELEQRIAESKAAYKDI
ncbi:MAG TPA: YtxH domain-containing protein [Gemmatimonadaceae bacterium]|nr:YtxH domain-containing protein [Gemmatimonadaceae bacterium]